ncbi:unnamed protein product [Cylicostephanus goldi]|uniref:Uncharacterized protein n=1 Tax=Cylicostephanus goldi TaxID=71465 RepID=A0A3P7N0R2_CYLGO|nr:unnamed protein product [Cylicostephanus goldi]
MAIVLLFLRRCSRNLPLETQERLSSILGGWANNNASITPEDLKLAEMKVLKDHQKQFSHTFTAAFNRKLNVRQDTNGLSQCYGRSGKKRTVSPFHCTYNVCSAQKPLDTAVETASEAVHKTMCTMSEV